MLKVSYTLHTFLMCSRAVKIFRAPYSIQRLWAETPESPLPNRSPPLAALGANPPVRSQPSILFRISNKSILYHVWSR